MQSAALAELVAELEDMTAEASYDDETVSWAAGVLGRPAKWVASELTRDRRFARQANESATDMTAELGT